MLNVSFALWQQLMKKISAAVLLRTLEICHVSSLVADVV